MKDQLTQTMQEIARLAAVAAEALQRGDMDAAFALQRETDLLWQSARKLGSRQGRRPALSKAPSVRERALTAVTELNVPASPKLIAAYAEALTGEAFDVRAIASIRRDEQRSWTSGSKREAYLVPALEGPWFVAGRGRFALSHWALSQRIIGPLSPRADHLKVCLQLCGRLKGGLANDAAQRLRTVLMDYARTVPGALENPWAAEDALDPARVERAAAAELSLIQVEDETWRKREAIRASTLLDEAQQLWGGAPPQVIDGKSG